MGRRVRPGPLAMAAFLLVASTGACVPDRPARTALDRVLATWPCRGAIRDALAAQGVGRAFLFAPPSRDGGSTLRIPMHNRLGSWVVLHGPSGVRGVTMERWDDTQVSVRVFDEACRTRVEESPSVRPQIDSLSFTDRDLRAAVASTLGARGAEDGLEGQGSAGVVVYAWSPHMPLSVDGFREIEAAADELGLRVVPVLFAGSDRDFARREATRVEMPPAALREVGSVELTMRDAQVHAPSILVFQGGRVFPVLPGYRNAAGYQRYLTAVLARGSG